MMFTLCARARLTAALALAAALLVSALGPLPSVGSAAEPAEPVARLQVVRTNIHIHDDRDWGDGEMSLTAGLYEGEGDAMANGVSPEAGMPVYAGRRYAFNAKIFESDSITATEYLGEIELPVHEGNGWGVGLATLRSTRDGKQGDFSLTFEIRRAPLPDLRPVNIKVNDLPGSTKKQVCVAVQNVENGHSGPFDVTLAVNGTVPPGGRATRSGPAPGNHVDACVEIDPPPPGEHRFKAVVDPSRALLEYNETNNAFEQTHTVAPPPSDLTVSAILANGRVVDGKDDCKKGKNNLVVVVKNTGTANAGSFDVRLAVDGAEAAVESVADLGAGQEREVRFDDVRLRNGKHSLVAVADAKGDVAESKEDNNDRAVTAECKDDD